MTGWVTGIALLSFLWLSLAAIFQLVVELDILEPTQQTVNAWKFGTNNIIE